MIDFLRQREVDPKIIVDLLLALSQLPAEVAPPAQPSVYMVDPQEVAKFIERKEADRIRANARRASYPGNWEELRLSVFRRDGYACTYCGVQDDNPHCDHIVPLSRGGLTDLDNLTTACRACNVSKGARTVEEWRGPQ